MKGKIKDIKRDFGFITGEDNKDYYFNQKSLTGGITLMDIKKGMDIEFDVQIQKDGRKSASNCRPFENESMKFFKEHVLILNEIKGQYDTFCDYARSYADRLKIGNVNTSMIRKIYARILNAREVAEIKGLRPHFAYTAGRNEKNVVLRGFMGLLDYLAKEMDINNQQHLDNFKQFMEAIVAYRKYVGKDE